MQALFVILMAFMVALSNFLVQFPLNDWITLGSFTYPICFLITEITNRHSGPKSAKQVVYVGFLVAVGISAFLAPLQIALASGCAFLLSQLLDILIFNRLRQKPWWQAPLFASTSASLIDTFVFFSLAFAGTTFSAMSLAAGDFAVKLAMDIILIAPFRMATRNYLTSFVAKDNL